MLPSDEVDTSHAAIVRGCQEYVADLLAMPVEQVDPTVDFDRLGVDSALAVSLLSEIEERYGVDLPPEALFEDPTIDEVARNVYRQIHAPGT